MKCQILAFVLVATLPLWVNADAAASDLNCAEFVEYEEGAAPLILVGGHGGGKRPAGWTERNNPNINKGRDSYTGYVGHRTRKRLADEHGIRPYWVYNQVHRRYVDVNRAPGPRAYESPEGRRVYNCFHGAIEKALKDALSKWDSVFLIDLHGQSNLPDDVYLGTSRRKSITELWARFGEQAITGSKSFQGALRAKGYTVPSDVPPPGPYDVPGPVSGGFTTPNYGRRDNIDAVQVEIHGRIRRDSQARATFADDFADAVAVFYEEYLKPAGD